MGDTSRDAVDTYRDTEFNCAQSVFAAFAPQLGLDRDTAMKIACGLGSGMGKTGNMCGAVTGGMLVLGLRYGMVEPDSTEDKARTYKAVALLLERIEKIHGSSNCTQLMGVDIGTPEGLDTVKKMNLAEKICSTIVQDVARIVEELLE